MQSLLEIIKLPALHKKEYKHVLCWIILSCFSTSYIIFNLYILLGIVILIELLKKTLNFQPGFLIIIFISFYLLYLIPVFAFNIPIGYHTYYNTPDNYLRTLSIFILFLIFINFFLKKIPYKVIIKDKLPQIKSYPFFFFLLIIQVYIIFQAIRSGASISGTADSYDVYINNLENSNGLWEYFFLVYFLAYLLAPDKYCKYYVLIIIFFIYLYVSITRGYRIQLIEMTFLVFILYLDGKFKNSLIVGGAIIGLVAMEIYGLFKLIGKLDIEYFINTFQSFDTVLISNQTEVFYSTTAVLALQHSGYFGWDVLWQTFLAFIINFIVPTGLLWKGSRILDHMHNVSDIGGGGFCFGYFYFWFGIIGVIAIAYFISWNINNCVCNNKYKLIYLVLFIALCPRWFAYEPTNHLIRLPLTLVIAYMIIMVIFKKKIKTYA